jgi:hypothetical protein
MFLTIEELCAFKSKYEEEIAELQRKKSVVDEFIAFAESKENVKSDEETEEVEETAEETVL